MADEKLFGKERVNMFIQDFFGIRFNVTLHILYRKIDIATIILIQGTKLLLLIYFKMLMLMLKLTKLQNVNSFHSFRFI